MMGYAAAVSISLSPLAPPGAPRSKGCLASVSVAAGDVQQVCWPGLGSVALDVATAPAARSYML